MKKKKTPLKDTTAAIREKAQELAVRTREDAEMGRYEYSFSKTHHAEIVYDQLRSAGINAIKTSMEPRKHVVTFIL